MEERCCVCGSPLLEGQTKVSRGLKGWAHAKCASKEIPAHMGDRECKSKN